jgi:hypothetical protein
VKIEHEVDPTNARIKSVYFFVFTAICLGFLLTLGIIIYFRFVSGYFNTDYPSIRPDVEVADNINFESSSGMLNADLVLDGIGMTYSDIKLDEILLSEGQYIDPDHTYMAYSFYFKNSGTETITVDYYMRIISTYNFMNEYVRVLVIQDDTVYQMYQKRDDFDDEPIEYENLPQAIEFESNTMIFRNYFEDFKPGEIKLFRVIMWLEEQDPDIAKNTLSGSIECHFNFSIRVRELAYESQPYILLNNPSKLWISFRTTCNIVLKMHYE